MRMKLTDQQINSLKLNELVSSVGNIKPPVQNLNSFPQNPSDLDVVYVKSENNYYVYDAILTQWKPIGNYSALNVATDSILGGIKSGVDISIDPNGFVTVLDNSHNHTVDNITDLQATLDGKASSTHNHNFSDLQNKPTTISGYGISPSTVFSELGLGTSAIKNVGTNAGNVPLLDSNGKLDPSIMPALSISETHVVSMPNDMRFLDAQVGDIAICSGTSESYILRFSPASELSNWQKLLFPSNGVSSINGRSGNVSLNKSDVGLDQVVNESKTTMFTNPVFVNPSASVSPNVLDDSTALATTEFVKSQNYLTQNQNITLSGDVTGSGRTNITLSLSNTGVLSGTYTKLTVDSKGRVTSGSYLLSSDIPNLDWSKIDNTPSTLSGYKITDAVKSTDVVNIATPNKILKLDASGKLPTSIVGNADTATKLQTPRTFTLSGDVTSTGYSFDGSSNVTINTTLPNVNPGGVYTKVVVDTKGRVTSYMNLDPYDIPSLDWSKITTGKPTTISGYGITDALSTSDVVSIATPNKILKLDATGKLPASITGNASSSNSVPWSGVTGRPNTLDGYGITDALKSSNVGTAAYVNTGSSPGNVPVIGFDGKLSSSIMPDITISETFVVNSSSEMLALNAQTWARSASMY